MFRILTPFFLLKSSPKVRGFLQNLRELNHVFELRKKLILLSFIKLNYREVLYPLLFCEKQLTGPVVFQFLLWQTADITEV